MLLSPSPWSAVTVVVVIVAIFLRHISLMMDRVVCACVCVRYVYTFQCMRIEYEFNAAHNAISNPMEERKPNDRERVKMK